MGKKVNKENLIKEGYKFPPTSTAFNHCLGVRNNDDGTVNIVDSKTNNTLTFTREEWRAFVKDVADGEFGEI